MILIFEKKTCLGRQILKGVRNKSTFSAVEGCFNIQKPWEYRNGGDFVLLSHDEGLKDEPGSLIIKHSRPVDVQSGSRGFVKPDRN